MRLGKTSGVVTTLLLGLALAGCSQDQGTVVEDAPSPQEQIQKIQNDPNMPPQAKAVAIQALQQQQAAATAQAQAAQSRGQAPK